MKSAPGTYIPCMAPGPRAPCAHAVVGADEIVAREGGVVAVGPTFDQLPVDLGTAVAAAVVGAERVAEGARGRGEEGRRKGPRGTLGEEGDARLELVGEPRQGGDGAVPVLLACVPGVILAVGVLI